MKSQKTPQTPPLNKLGKITRLASLGSLALLLASVACVPSTSQPSVPTHAQVMPVSQLQAGPLPQPVQAHGSATLRIKLAPGLAKAKPEMRALGDGGFRVQVIPAETTRIEIKVRYDANDTTDITSVNIGSDDIAAARSGSGEIVKTLDNLPVGQELYLRIQAFENQPPEVLVAEYEKTDFKVKGTTLTGGSKDSQHAVLTRVAVGIPPRQPECVSPTCYTQRIRYSWNAYTFDVSDPDGDDVKLHINWGDGSAESISDYVAGTGSGQVSVQHSYRQEGTYTITAIAYDERGRASAPYTQEIQITSYPSAELPMDPTCSVCPESGEVGEPVSFDIRIGNVNGNTYKASVNWGDGTTPHPESSTVTTTGVVPLTHTFTEPGTYTVRFANWDQYSARSENLLERTIVIGDAPEPSPSPPEGEYTNPVNMTFVSLQGGTFTMGSPEGEGDSDERPQHSVTLSPFQMQTTEVTQKQWWDVMGSWPGSAPSSTYGVGDNHPMYYVSWCDIVGKEADNSCSNEDSFLKRLNANYPGTYRLPTEAEWEYAARAGTTTEYACGTGVNFNSGANANACPWNMAWLGDNNTYGGETSGTKEVGRKLPNAWGLYDMHGNVYEWVHDWYRYSYYSSSPSSNPTGPSTGSYRVVRGGYWWNNLAYYVARSASRHYYTPTFRDYSIGFRVVRLP